MQKFLFKVVLLFFVSSASYAQTELFFSEYIEGSSNNKAVEIYNGTGAPVDLATGVYKILIYSNANTSPNTTITLTGTVADKDVFVVGNSSFVTGYETIIDLSTGSLSFNGDDAVILTKNGVVIDAIGKIAEYTEWGTGDASTKDNTIRRKTTICSGDTDGTDAFDPATEWDGYGINTLDDLGQYTSGCGPAVLTLSIADASIIEGNSGTANLDFIVSLNMEAPAGGVSFDIATTDSTAIAGTDYIAQSLTGQVIAEGDSTFTFSVVINGDTDTEVDEFLNINISNVTGAAEGTLKAIGTIVSDDFATFAIHDIQGSASQSTMVGTTLKVSGIVTRIFPGLEGFYIQEEEANYDADATTSEGIFIYDNGGIFNGAVGDKVTITGDVDEFYNLTQIDNLTSIEIVSSSNTLPAAIEVVFPVQSIEDLESYEGMLVTAKASSGDLTVTEINSLGRYGEVTLASTGNLNHSGTDSRIEQFSQFSTPDITANTAYLEDIEKRTIILDDANSSSNPSTIIFGRGGQELSATNTLRGGDTVSEITAVLGYSYSAYRLLTTQGVNFVATNPRTTAPAALAGNVKVAAFNVLNYFTTLGGSGRGADNAVEFQRQKDKTVNAIIDSGADVIGLMEIENNLGSADPALVDLITNLNAIAGAGTYNYVDHGTTTGTDAITVAIIYKPASVSLSGTHAVLTTGTYATLGRGVLAQTFLKNINGVDEKFTLAVVHFKSKGSVLNTANEATGDGQGNNNPFRLTQAQELKTWLDTDPTTSADPDYLVVGDFNAYAKEDPIAYLEGNGYVNLNANTSYSYVYQGMWGSLDHAFASTTLNNQVEGSEKWHINADEPSILDYNTEYKTSGQLRQAAEILEASLYNSDAYRSSDHDPIVIGVTLNSSTLAVNFVSFSGRMVNNTVELNWTTSEEVNSHYFEVQKSYDGNEFSSIGKVNSIGSPNSANAYTYVDQNNALALAYYRIIEVDYNGSKTYSKLIAVEKENTFVIYPNPTAYAETITVSGNVDGLKIYDLAGKKQAVKVLKINNSTAQFKNTLDSGVYLLKNNKGLNQKFIVK